MKSSLYRIFYLIDLTLLTFVLLKVSPNSFLHSESHVQTQSKLYMYANMWRKYGQQTMKLGNHSNMHIKYNISLPNTGKKECQAKHEKGQDTPRM